MSIPKPNYTQIPNIILDDYWPDMSEAEAKVVIAICRKTFGWHKREDKLSLSQLMKLAGLSRQGVINGVEAAMQRGVLGRRQVGQSFMYFVLVNDARTKELQLTSSDSVTPTRWTLQQLMEHRKMGMTSPCCAYCGEDNAGHLDHWMPVSRGGLDEQPNLVRACDVCNLGKGSMTGEEFVGLLLRRGWLVNEVDQTSELTESQSTNLTTLVNEVDTQKKEKEIKETSTHRPNIFSVYEQHIGMLTPFTRDELLEIESTYPEGWFEDAVKEAVLNNKRNLKYVQAILKRWQAEGRGDKRTSSGRAGPRTEEIDLSDLIRHPEQTANE